MGGTALTPLVSSDDFDAKRLAFISAKLISFPAGFFAPGLPFALLCATTHDVPPVALKSQIGHNIGSQPPISPRSVWARSGSWLRHVCGGVELRNAWNLVQNDVVVGTSKCPCRSCRPYATPATSRPLPRPAPPPVSPVLWVPPLLAAPSTQRCHPGRASTRCSTCSPHFYFYFLIFFWTQESRKHANQPHTSSSVGQTTRRGTCEDGVIGGEQPKSVSN